MKKAAAATCLAQQLGLPKSRGVEAVMKAQLIAAVLREVTRQQLTHAELAERTGLSRSAVTGILSGSLQKITIDRVLRLVEAVGLEPEIKLRRKSTHHIKCATGSLPARVSHMKEFIHTGEQVTRGTRRLP